ncbi:MAG: DUF58 domain-containing protein [Eubacterium sp.]|nr:DUF58 domain-containing protein [Eubacterium sp.]
MIHLGIIIVLIGVLVYIAALLNQMMLAIFAFALSGLLILSYAVILWRMCFLKINIDTPMMLARSGEPVSICFRTNAKKSLLGTARVRADVQVRQLPKKKAERIGIELYVPSGGELNERRNVTMQLAGGYEYQLRAVRIYDWSGHFYLTKRVKSRAMLYLLPQIHAISLHLSEAVKNFQGEAEIYDDLCGGTDHSEVFQIREYQQGDRLQNIHWKLSAKEEELMVREHSMPKGCPVVLILDNRSMQHKKSRMKDAFLQIAASLSFALYDANCPHIISWYDANRQDVVRMRVDDEDTFWEWQLQYMMTEECPESVDALLRYAEKYRNEMTVHQLHLKADLSLYIDGKHFYTSKLKANVKDELEHMTLRL